MSILVSPWGSLFYKKTGKGKTVTLLIHGFGQTHEDMLHLDSCRQDHDTFIYLDMFYHGRSSWKNPEVPLDRRKWLSILELLQQKEQFQTFHLIGYSMGGKWSLLTYELIPTQVKSLMLIGPDGIKTGQWYSTSNYPNYFQPLFKRLIFRPQRVFRIFDGLQQLGVVQRSIHKFVSTQMSTRSKRAQIFFVWKVYGRTKVDLPRIITSANELKTPIRLFIGEFDAMISEKHVTTFLKRTSTAELRLLPVGHGQLIQQTAAHLCSKKNQENLR
ncbi:alpha/beta fold hydrolase [Algoriphagus namhaensis]